MNKIILMGRLVRDPEIRYSQGEKPVATAKYSLAVGRKYKQNGETVTDYFNIVAFSYQADFAAKYLRQGTKILLSGRVQTGSYENREHVKMPTFDIVVEEQEFAESKKENRNNSPVESKGDTAPFADNNGFMQLPDDMDELPFN